MLGRKVEEAQAGGQAPRVWVDTDIALGAPSGDVDDGFALAAVVRAALRGQAELIGVSVVAGNTTAGQARSAAQALLAAAGVGLPVIEEAQAAAALAALPQGTRLLALGPLSNVARALTWDPGLPLRVELHAVLGVRHRAQHPILPLFDLNRRRDPAAARQVLGARFVGRRICPLDVVARLRFGARDLAQIREASPLGAYLADHSARWLRRAPIRYLARRFPVWDLVAALDVLHLLPGAIHEGEQLAGFDVEAARGAFMELLRERESP